MAQILCSNDRCNFVSICNCLLGSWYNPHGNVRSATRTTSVATVLASLKDTSRLRRFLPRSGKDGLGMLEQKACSEDPRQCRLRCHILVVTIAPSAAGYADGPGLVITGKA